MKTYLYKGVVLASLLLMLCFTVKAQNTAGKHHRDISFILSNKADLDCMETELLQSLEGISLVYSNPNSGLMILKSDIQDKASLLRSLNDCILNKNESIKIEVIEPSATYYLSSK